MKSVNWCLLKGWGSKLGTMLEGQSYRIGVEILSVGNNYYVQLFRSRLHKFFFNSGNQIKSSY